jgi:hypothetical protein
MGWSIVLVLVAGTVGVVSLLHPVAGWFPGQPHKSSAPPVVGVGGIVFPLAAVVFIGWRAWLQLSLSRAARKAERARRGPSRAGT